MKEETVYPGCILAERMMTYLLCGFPRVSSGMSRPLNDFARHEQVACYLMCAIMLYSFLSP